MPEGTLTTILEANRWFWQLLSADQLLVSAAELLLKADWSMPSWLADVYAADFLSSALNYTKMQQSIFLVYIYQ